MNVLDHFYRSSLGTAASLVAGTALLVFSGVLLYAHAITLEQVRDVSVPLAAELPQLERTASILKEQTELAELEAASTVGSVEERVRTYILPVETDLNRVVATFEVIRDALQSEGSLSRMSGLTFGDRTAQSDGTTVQPLSVSFAVSKSGMQDIILLMRLAGIMTVGGALTPEELTILLEQTEAENPAGIVALEQYLSTDLISYAENSRVAEDRLLRSFSSTNFTQTLQNISHISLLEDAARMLGGDIGHEFDRYNLWPMQLMTIEKVSIVPGSAEGWYTLTLGLHLHTRES